MLKRLDGLPLPFCLYFAQHYWNLEKGHVSAITKTEVGDFRIERPTAFRHHVYSIPRTVPLLWTSWHSPLSKKLQFSNWMQSIPNPNPN
jgi:hypothetical protein